MTEVGPGEGVGEEACKLVALGRRVGLWVPSVPDACAKPGPQAPTARLRGGGVRCASCCGDAWATSAWAAPAEAGAD